MKAVIPAAGIGTRLRPHTLNKPKALLPVAGKPILAHIVDDLAAAGIDGFVIIVGFHGEAVRAWFAAERPHLDITYIEQEQRLGLGHAIWTAREALGDEPFFCILGDTILKADYAALLACPDNMIAVREVADPRRFGVVILDGDRVAGFVEKPAVPPSNLAIVGAYLFRDAPRLWAGLDRVVREDRRTRGEYQLTDGLQLMLEGGAVFRTVTVADWYDCGKPETWLETNRVLLDRERPAAAGGVEVTPPCAIAPGVEIVGSPARAARDGGPGRPPRELRPARLRDRRAFALDRLPSAGEPRRRALRGAGALRRGQPGRLLRGKGERKRMSERHLFTSESVTEGHPDKVADQISDAVVDAILADDPMGRVACETLVTTGMALVAGEISTSTYVDIPRIVRRTVQAIGYDHGDYGFDAKNCAIMTTIDEQSPDIWQGVGTGGAGDQGLMFGYACRETDVLMPLPITVAHRMAHRLTEVRKQRLLPWVRPDGKTQVTVEYEDGKPVAIDTVVVSTQHDADIAHADICEAMTEHVIQPTLELFGVPAPRLKTHINPTGKFVIGGPQGDTGLTGRKIIVDTYGGYAPHGGGAFSGKDPTKVDRSACYAARWVAKNLVAAGLADRCLVQLAYAIGVAEPVSIMIETSGTGQAPDARLTEAVRKTVDLTPRGIIERLNLRRPVFLATAAYGHFGRTGDGFTWENLDLVRGAAEGRGLGLPAAGGRGMKKPAGRPRGLSRGRRRRRDSDHPHDPPLLGALHLAEPERQRQHHDEQAEPGQQALGHPAAAVGQPLEAAEDDRQDRDVDAVEEQRHPADDGQRAQDRQAVVDPGEEADQEDHGAREPELVGQFRRVLLHHEEAVREEPVVREDVGVAAAPVAQADGDHHQEGADQHRLVGALVGLAGVGPDREPEVGHHRADAGQREPGDHRVEVELAAGDEELHRVVDPGRHRRTGSAAATGGSGSRRRPPAAASTTSTAPSRPG